MLVQDFVHSMCSLLFVVIFKGESNPAIPFTCAGNQGNQPLRRTTAGPVQELGSTRSTSRHLDLFGFFGFPVRGNLVGPKEGMVREMQRRHALGLLDYTFWEHRFSGKEQA